MLYFFSLLLLFLHAGWRGSWYRLCFPFSSIDPQNVGEIYFITLQLSSQNLHAWLFHSFLFSKHPFLNLSVSPHVLLSIMSDISVQCSSCECVFSFCLLTVKFIELRDCGHGHDVFACMDLRESSLDLEAPLCLYVSPVCVWDVQLTSSATGGKCWSVSPQHHSTLLSSLAYFHFLLSWVHILWACQNNTQ